MFGFAGFTDVNDGFLSMSLQRRGSAIFNGNLAEISVADNDIVVISGCNGDVAQLKKVGGKIILYSPNAKYIDYMIFNTSTAKSSGYGVETYDSNGRVIFSSNHKFLRPIKGIDTNLNKGAFIETQPSGSKYGVILSNYGFTLNINPDFCRRVMRSVRLDGNIKFNVVNYDDSGAGRIGMSYNDNSYFFNAIIVDITNY